MRYLSIKYVNNRKKKKHIYKIGIPGEKINTTYNVDNIVAYLDSISKTGPVYKEK